MTKLRYILAGMAMLVATPAFTEGFLVGRMEKVPDLTIGLGESGFEFKQEPFQFETGKGYRMWIKSTGKQECAFRAPDFFQHVWFRKIEVNKVELKFSSVHEIEFEREGEAELFFTPIRPGEYKWECGGVADKGLTGTFSVK